MSRAWFGRVVSGVVEGCGWVERWAWKGAGGCCLDGVSGVEGRGRAGGGAVVGVWMGAGAGGFAYITGRGCGRIEGVYEQCEGRDGVDPAADRVERILGRGLVQGRCRGG